LQNGSTIPFKDFYRKCFLRCNALRKRCFAVVRLNSRRKLFTMGLVLAGLAVRIALDSRR
jgi:hypothetical protein